MTLTFGRKHRLDNIWLIPPEDACLPLLSVTVLGEDDSKPVTVLVKEFIAKWEDAFGVAGRSGELRARDLAARNDWCLLVLILANQTPEVLAEAAAIVAAAGNLEFQGVALAALGEQPAPELEKIAKGCAMAIITKDIKLLLHPLRILAGYHSLIGYDFSDLRSLYAGRLAGVRQGSFGTGAQPPVEIARGIDVTACCCLMLSNAEGRLAIGDAILAPLRAHAGAAGLDFIWAINGHWEAEDYIEWAIFRERTTE